MLGLYDWRPSGIGPLKPLLNMQVMFVTPRTTYTDSPMFSTESFRHWGSPTAMSCSGTPPAQHRDLATKHQFSPESPSSRRPRSLPTYLAQRSLLVPLVECFFPLPLNGLNVLGRHATSLGQMTQSYSRTFDSNLFSLVLGPLGKKPFEW